MRKRFVSTFNFGFLNSAWLLLFLMGLTVHSSSFVPLASASAPADPSEAQIESANIFVGLAKKIVPTVVNVFTVAKIKLRTNVPGRGESPFGAIPGGPGADLWRHFFDQFFGGEAESPFGDDDDRGGRGSKGGSRERIQSLGSGFVIERNAEGVLILTNAHVIEGADGVKVKFTEAVDEKESTAEIVGRDRELDVAVLKVKTKDNIPVATLGDSEALEQGAWVMAAGNPFGHGHSVSKGIVSAKERTLPGSFSRYLQVDVPINPGNSGGPLANLRGEVVGINNAIQANAQGIGFAIPINAVKSVLLQLKTKGHVDRGYVGVNVEDIKPDLAKILGISQNLMAPVVTHVIEGGPGAQAGLQVYDVVLNVNGKTVKTAADLVGVVTSTPIGQKVQFKVLRQGHERIVGVKVGKRPQNDHDEDENAEESYGREKTQKSTYSSGLIVEPLDASLKRELMITKKMDGVVVIRVQYGSPADEAGFSRGDVILEVDRKTVRSIEDLDRSLASKKRHLVRVRRLLNENGAEGFAVVTLDNSA